MSHRLAVFDIDGTIAVKGIIPASVVSGIQHLHDHGFLTTVSTGRSYLRLRDALGESFTTVVSPDALISVEHGTKIVRSDGSVVQADYFSSAEKEHFVDFVQANADMVTFCMYALPDPTLPLELWVKQGENVEEIRKKRGSYSHIFQSTWEELKERMHTHEISHTLAKLKDFVAVENLKISFTRSKMNVHFMDTYMQFVGSFTDKATAIQYLEKFHNVKVEDMLIAGNGINDVDMLNLPAARRILVGSGVLAESVLGYLRSQDAVIRTESPETLGDYLQTIK